jgi:type I restriction enzyme M protein
MTEVSEIKQILKDAKTIMSTNDDMHNDGTYVPEISWILFLKVFDYHERQRISLIKGYKTIFPEEIQWKSWAADRFKGYSGRDLEKFMDNILFDTLSKLTGSKEDRNIDILHDIFDDFQYKLRNGTKLRQVINELNKIELNDSQDLENLSKVYEDELLSMRNSLKGKPANFYTPLPIIKFIVQNIDPNFKKSERVMDLASGTSGFILESMKHMKKDIKEKKEIKILHSLLFGKEKKSKHYLLGVLNMMLHDVGTPQIFKKNTLGTTKISEIVTDNQKYDVIIFNPTFDEKEEPDVANNMPAGKRNGGTRFQFLYTAMKSLKENGRCAIILDNGPLFGETGTPYDIKKELLEKYNLHTIVRLPESVFSPYTGIPTNILFFDAGKPTKYIWYYRMKVREGLKNYNKSNPILDSDFDDVLKWCKNKESNEYGYKVSVDNIKDYRLDLKHPDDEKVLENISPHELIGQIISNEKITLNLLIDVENLINSKISKH